MTPFSIEKSTLTFLDSTKLDQGSINVNQPIYLLLLTYGYEYLYSLNVCIYTLQTTAKKHSFSYIGQASTLFLHMPYLKGGSRAGNI